MTETKALNNWRKDNLFNKESNTIMRLNVDANRFVIEDKDIDRLEAQEHIARRSFVKLDTCSYQKSNGFGKQTE